MPHMTRLLDAPRVRCALVALAVGGTLAIVPAAGAAAADPPPAPAATTATTSTQPATTQPSTIAGRCTQYEDELRRDAPPGGWDVVQMSTYMARESSCSPAARSARDTGLLQINDINHPYLRTVLHEFVGRWSLTDPVQNIKAAATLCEYWRGRGESCYYPWKLDLYRPPGAPATQPPATQPPATQPPVTPVPKPGTAPVARAPAAGRCVQYEALLTANAPPSGWDVLRMSRLMSTTSGCLPSKRWSTATGLLRISDSNQPWLRLKLGANLDRRSLTDPTQNIRAAAALCQLSVARGGSCYQPWQG